MVYRAKRGRVMQEDGNDGGADEGTDTLGVAENAQNVPDACDEASSEDEMDEKLGRQMAFTHPNGVRPWGNAAQGRFITLTSSAAI